MVIIYNIDKSDHRIYTYLYCIYINSSQADLLYAFPWRRNQAHLNIRKHDSWLHANIHGLGFFDKL